MKLFSTLASWLFLAAAIALPAGAQAQKTYTIGMIAKSQGNPFFEASRVGANDAAKELGQKLGVGRSGRARRTRPAPARSRDVGPCARAERLLVQSLTLSATDHAPRHLLCLGAHCDDIEIGCSGASRCWPRIPA